MSCKRLAVAGDQPDHALIRQAAALVRRLPVMDVQQFDSSFLTVSAVDWLWRGCHPAVIQCWVAVAGQAVVVVSALSHDINLSFHQSTIMQCSRQQTREGLFS